MTTMSDVLCMSQTIMKHLDKLDKLETRSMFWTYCTNVCSFVEIIITTCSPVVLLILKTYVCVGVWNNGKTTCPIVWNNCKKHSIRWMRQWKQHVHVVGLRLLCLMEIKPIMLILVCVLFVVVLLCVWNQTNMLVCFTGMMATTNMLGVVN